jgi:hypothetical protein
MTQEEVKEVPQTEEKPAEVEAPKETLKLKEDPNIEIIDGVKYPKDIVEKARKQGWKDKEQLEKLGKSEKYKTPDEFARRGDEIIPFLKKRLEKEAQEKETLKKLLQKHIKSQISGQVENIEDKLKEAKELGESDKIERLVQKKITAQQELKQLEEEAKPVNPQIEYNQKRQEIAQATLEWELRNTWCYDSSNPKTKYANAIFTKIINRNPNLDINRVLSIVDENVRSYEAKQTNTKQKKNLSIPSINQGVSTASTNKISRSIKNLKPEMKAQFDEDATDMNGKPLKGNDLKVYTKEFLSVCKDHHFIN